MVGVGQAWWSSPFFRHNRRVTKKDIDQLVQSGIGVVLIDPSRGLDVTKPEHEDGGVGDVTESEREDEDVADDTCSSTGLLENLPGDPNALPNLDHQEDSPCLTTQASLEAACKVRDDAIKAVEDVFEGVKTGMPIDQPLLQQTANKLLDRVFNEGEALAEAVIIQNLKHFDKALYDHVVDVAVLSLLVGVQVGLDEEELHSLAIGALLHDVGYTRLPKNLLRRKQNLIGDEQTLFNRHPEFGFSILQTCPTLSDEARRIVLEHHERQDGSGYPHGLNNTAISTLSEIVGLIDRFDGLVSHWGGGVPLPSALAIRSLYQEARAEKLGQTPVEALIKCLGVYPAGSLVSLTTGEQAVVLKANPQEKLKPIVKMITDTMGKPCQVPLVIDLSVPDSSSGDRAIASVLDPDMVKVNVVKYLEIT